MHLDGASSILHVFSRVWTVWVLLGNLVDAAPEVSLQGLRSVGLFSSLTECCPWGKPRRILLGGR
jgi:hypothetical protein